METLHWKDRRQSVQRSKYIEQGERQTHRQSELGVLLLPGSKTFKRQEQEAQHEWRMA